MLLDPHILHGDIQLQAVDPVVQPLHQPLIILCLVVNQFLLELPGLLLLRLEVLLKLLMLFIEVSVSLSDLLDLSLPLTDNLVDTLIKLPVNLKKLKPLFLELGYLEVFRVLLRLFVLSVCKQFVFVLIC